MLPANANPSSPDVSVASASLITSSEWQTHTTMSSDHLPILMGLQTTATPAPTRLRSYINLKKADWTRYRQEIECKLRPCHLPSDCQKTTVVLSYTIEAASHHIATGRRKLHAQQVLVLVEILAMMEEQDDLRQQGPASSTMNDEITKVTSDYKRRQWREFVESMDHRTGSTKLWRTIKGIDGISNQTAKNEGSTQDDSHQFVPSKLCKHSSSRRTCQVSRM